MKDIHSDREYVIIAYDIIKNRARRRVMNILKGYGLHAQKSVFECYLNEVQLKELELKILHEIDEEKDSVRFYRLPQREIARIEIIGCGQIYEEPQLVLL